MKVLALERTLANAIMGGARSFANLWLLPAPSLVGERIGIQAEPDEAEGFWEWFYRGRLGLKFPESRSGALGTARLVRTAKPFELGRGAFGPAVWVFDQPRIETVEGRAFRAGYSDQPHVRERDRLSVQASASKE